MMCLIRSCCVLFGSLVLGSTVLVGSASAQILELPSPGAMLPYPDDGLIRSEFLVVGVSKTGKRVHALSLKSGELHAVQVNAASPEEIRIAVSGNFAAFKFKNKAYAISARQGGWQEIELKGEQAILSVGQGCVEVHSGNRHDFFVDVGTWLTMDLDAE